MEILLRPREMRVRNKNFVVSWKVKVMVLAPPTLWTEVHTSLEVNHINEIAQWPEIHISICEVNTIKAH